MGRITLQEAARWCGGQIDPKYKDITFLGANNDTRTLKPGQLFVALKGARDGHAFIPTAMEQGAAAVLCSHCDGDYPAIVVDDPRLALGQIAKQERQRIGMKVVGITGSVGKTTTKEMVAAVLEMKYRVEKTPVNHNNDIGMPMAILSMPEDTQFAVLEMGMNHFREIAYLSEIANPDIAVIVNIGTMHIEHLGSMEGILQAKLEILEGMREGGRVILNGDDPLLWNQHKVLKDALYFGVQNPDCSVIGDNVVEEPEQLCFTVQHEKDSFAVTLPLEGAHYILDALAAVSVGLECDVPGQQICKALSQFVNADGRQEIFRAGAYTIIKDCYNAGPESMSAALSVLRNKPGRRIAVLGDMLELGTCTQAEHYRVGRLAAENVDLLFAYGPNSERTLNGAITGGMPESRARAFTDAQRLVSTLKQLAQPGDVILFKGSRGMKMELLLEAFLKDEPATEECK